MKQTFGQRLSTLRKENGCTQDELAKRLGVTPQAVSKWENDLSCPDIMLLPELAKIYHISIDELFAMQRESDADFDNISPVQTQEDEKSHREPPKKAVNYENLFLKVFVTSGQGDDVKVQIPVSVVLELLRIGVQIPALSDLAGTDLSGLDLTQIFRLIEAGVIGELAQVTTSNGDIVYVVVEEK